MRIYETTFILNPQTDDATLDQQATKVSSLVADNGGTILAEKRMGTRRLAYPIRKLTQGFYTSLVYEAPPELPPILTRHFRLGEEFLRYMTILFEGDLKSLHEDQESEQAVSRVEKEESSGATRSPVHKTPEKTVPAETAPVVESTPESTPEPVMEDAAPEEQPDRREAPVFPTFDETEDDEQELL